jgi:hypothetical protein
MQACTFSTSLQQVRGRQVSHASVPGSATATGHIGGYHLLAGGRPRCLETTRQSLPDWAEAALVGGTIGSGVTAAVATVIALARASDRGRPEFQASFSYRFSYAMMFVLTFVPGYNWMVRT